MSFQPLKLALARDYLQMMANRTGCSSSEEYIITHEIPEEKRKALQELMKDGKSNSSYQHMIEYLQDKERFDINKIRSFGLDVQYLVSIDCCGKVDIDAYVVGQGIFYCISDLDNYALWNDIYIDENGDTILPYYNFDSNNPEEQLINISKSDIDRDFRAGNVVENMIWCIHNMEVEALEDYEYEVFGYHKDTVDFSMSMELLTKIIRPNAVSTIYTDRIMDLETGIYMTEFDSEKVFMEDFND